MGPERTVARFVEVIISIVMILPFFLVMALLWFFYAALLSFFLFGTIDWNMCMLYSLEEINSKYWKIHKLSLFSWIWFTIYYVLNN